MAVLGLGMDKLKIVQIGSGNVATHLTKALKGAGHNIVQIVGRTLAHAQVLGDALGVGYANSMDELDRSADLYIISVADSDIPMVVSSLPKLNGLVVHTSGSTSIETLTGVSERYGVFYPFQTFSKQREVSLSGVPFCIESHAPEVTEILSTVAQSVGGIPVEMDSQQRRWLHLMGVLSCNFVNHLFHISKVFGETKGLDFAMLKPLVNETVNKAFEAGPERSQTGPAVRGDEEIMRSQLELLKQLDSQWAEIYRLMSESIAKMGKQNRG